MILSDVSIRAAIEEGRIIMDPFDPAMVQPSSIDGPGEVRHLELPHPTALNYQMSLWDSSAAVLGSLGQPTAMNRQRNVFRRVIPPSLQ